MGKTTTTEPAYLEQDFIKKYGLEAQRAVLEPLISEVKLETALNAYREMVQNLTAVALRVRLTHDLQMPLDQRTAVLDILGQLVGTYQANVDLAVRVVKAIKRLDNAGAGPPELDPADLLVLIKK